VFSETRNSGSTEGLGYEQFTDLNGKRLVDIKAIEQRRRAPAR
jgi:hypothetical protein